MSTKHTPREIRLTIPVSPEVHAVFLRMSDAFRRPVGRLMGEWLQDHLQAADDVCRMVEGMRSSQSKAASLGALAASYGDQADALISAVKVGAKSGAVREVQGAHGPHPTSARKAVKRAGTPPYSNTGGKGSEANTPKGSK